jgi:hypothetical protein
MITETGKFDVSAIMKFAHEQTKANLSKYKHSYAVEFKYQLKLAYMVARTQCSIFNGREFVLSTLGD